MLIEKRRQKVRKVSKHLINKQQVTINNVQESI